MSDNPLQTIMAPRSIAIVGASNNPTKMGTIQYLNLRHSGFPGPVYPIHPKENEIFGVEAYPRIEDLPEVPDLAMLVVPSHLVPDMIERFGALGTRHAVIITAGFKETGQEDFLKLPYHQAILNDKIPLSIGGGIGQARTYMYLLRTAHLGEVTVTVWPQQLKDICAPRNIHVLE